MTPVDKKFLAGVQAISNRSEARLIDAVAKAGILAS